VGDLFPILIASKGRASTSSTIAALLDDGLMPCLFVEPQEWGAYRAAYPAAECVMLEQNDHGLPYVRQQILERARARGVGWYWMLDDDITAFYQVARGRNVKVAPRVALAGAQALFAHLPDVAQAGLEYQQFAWSARRPVVFNSYCDVAVCIHVDRTRMVNNRPATDLKVDRDFTLQILATGYRTAKVCAFAFAAPKNGSNAGGLHAAYATDRREAQASQVMARLWPGICTFRVKPDGRPDVAIDWRQLAPRPPKVEAT
jgi:hypothetical protein